MSRCLLVFIEYHDGTLLIWFSKSKRKRKSNLISCVCTRSSCQWDITSTRTSDPEQLDVGQRWDIQSVLLLLWESGRYYGPWYALNGKKVDSDRTNKSVQGMGVLNNSSKSKKVQRKIGIQWLWQGSASQTHSCHKKSLTTSGKEGSKANFTNWDILDNPSFYPLSQASRAFESLIMRMEIH